MIGSRRMEDILMLPTPSSAITSHGPHFTDQKGPPTTWWHFSQGLLFILFCFVAHALRQQVNWSKRAKLRQIISFWNPFVHVSIVLCWTDAWVMFQDKEIQFKTTTMLIKNLVGISITLSPRRESICCQGSSQTRNWATTGSRHLTRWYHAGGLVEPAACQSQFFSLPHFLSKLTRALWMKF